MEILARRRMAMVEPPEPDAPLIASSAGFPRPLLSTVLRSTAAAYSPDVWAIYLATVCSTFAIRIRRRDVRHAFYRRHRTSPALLAAVVCATCSSRALASPRFR